MKAWPNADEMVVLRRPSRIYPGVAPAHWKITARYEVIVPRGRRMKCVRVRGYSASSSTTVLHLELSVFREMFKPDPDRNERFSKKPAKEFWDG